MNVGFADSTMHYWLMKSEPDTFSWDDLLAKPKRTERWDGVRNHQAKANLMAMKLGDRAFFYHSVTGKAVVGVCTIVKEHYPDPTDETGKFVAVDVKALHALLRPVTLDEIRTHPSLAEMVLVKNSRLSVQPVTAAQWRVVEGLGNRG